MISSVERQAKRIAQSQTKVQNSLGILEDCAIEVCKILNTLKPQLNRPTLVLAASDHGIANCGVTCSKQEVSAQMFRLFASGNGTCAVLCEHNGVSLNLVDVGLISDVAASLEPSLPWIRVEKCKTRCSTSDFTKAPALELSELEFLIEAGRKKVQSLAAQGCNCIILGEMGIGNTTTAGALMSALCKMDASNCLPRGSATDEVMQHKLQFVRTAVESFKAQNPEAKPLELVLKFGGFEFIYLAGIVAEAHKQNLLILNDGFLTTVAVLIASVLFPGSQASVLCCHYTGEEPHKLLLDYLGLKPILDLKMHLGEGTGALASVPFIQESLTIFNNLKAFTEAGVSCKPCEKKLPFALGTSSYILPADILPNLDFLKDKVDDVELVLFESGDITNLPNAEVLAGLKACTEQYGTSYTVHLPYDVKAGSFDEAQRLHAVDTWIKFIERTKVLNVHGFIVHLEPERYRNEDNTPCLEPSNNVPKWTEQVKKSLEELKMRLPSDVKLNLICIETLSYDLMPLVPFLLEKGFSITLDVGHLWLNGLYSPEYVKALLPHTRIIHLHGVTGLKDHQSLAVHDKKQLKEFFFILSQYCRIPIVVTLEIFSQSDLESSLEVLHSLEVF